MRPFVNDSVLIISDDPEFARAIAANWQGEHTLPEFTVATSDVWHPSVADGYAAITVGPVRDGRLKNILSSLDHSAGFAVICVTSDEKTCAALQTAHPHLLFLSQQQGWTSILTAVSGEALRRIDALRRAQRAERLAFDAQNYATLGRYMLEMRSSVNNALTSVLGNADLLLLNTGQMVGDSREQVQTIHAMTLRLSEIMQRFSSLVSELKLSEKESQAETERAEEPVGAGTHAAVRRC
jgi:signal transduction histidine kinase